MNDCCEEYAGLNTAISRRGLLRGALGVGATTALFGTTFTQTSYAATRSAPRTIVLLSLRGAADGLSLVVPHGDPAYYSARPRIAVPSAALVAKESFFGLHPSLSPLLPLWNAGKMAAVHATGMPVANRSHFSAMEAIEDADPGSSARIGWINRLIGRDGYTNSLQAVGLGMTSPITALYGPQGTVTTAAIEDMNLAGVDEWDKGRRRRSLTTIWGSAGGAAGRGARAALAAVSDFAPVRATPTKPANGAAYLDDDLGRALRETARTIKGDVGAEVVAVDHDGDWDMHTNLGTLEWGTMLNSAKSLATNLAAFFTDLGPTWGDRVTLVTLSEFGRRVKENANYGLDHGHGNVMFLIGGGVKGGYHGTWPGLTNSLDADLSVTLDYRSVLAELVSKRLGASVATVFPGLAPEPVGAVL
jgi:uncharacterized protein (DUF1501 family)